MCGSELNVGKSGRTICTGRGEWGKGWRGERRGGGDGGGCNFSQFSWCTSLPYILTMTRDVSDNFPLALPRTEEPDASSWLRLIAGKKSENKAVKERESWSIKIVKTLSESPIMVFTMPRVPLDSWLQCGAISKCPTNFNVTTGELTTNFIQDIRPEIDAKCRHVHCYWNNWVYGAMENEFVWENIGQLQKLCLFLFRNLKKIDEPGVVRIFKKLKIPWQILWAIPSNCV